MVLSEYGAAPQLDIHGLVLLFRRRLRILIFVPVAVTAAALVSVANTTPQYRSSADILIGRTQAEALFTPSGLVSYSNPDRALANQIRVVHSQQVAELAKKRLGFAAGIAATASTSEDLITLSAVQTSGAKAAAVANAYATAYLDYRRSSASQQNIAVQTELKRQITETEGAIAAPGPQPDRTSLLAQLATQRSQLAQLEAAANVDQGGAQLLGPATVPTAPFEPKPIRSGAVGLAVGLLLGVGLALLRDTLDKRIRTREDLELVSGTLPVVGLVPLVPGGRKGAPSRIASLEDPASAAAEAYRSLRTSIEFLGVDRSLRTLQITSATAGEGKTTTLVNLAVALARAGRRVVVVDCDLRRPTVHEFFGLKPEIGFTSLLTGDVAMRTALQPVPGVDGLLVLPSGPVPPNPSELLSGRRTKEVLAGLQADADIVLVDSPPVLPVSDAVALATRVDAVLVVASANSTHRHDLARAIERLRQVDAAVVGTVFNRAGAGRDGYGSYGYGAYGESQPRRTGLQRFRPRRGR